MRVLGKGEVSPIVHMLFDVSWYHSMTMSVTSGRGSWVNEGDPGPATKRLLGTCIDHINQGFADSINLP